jgi:twitching motility two-component system response regulator PilH
LLVVDDSGFSRGRVVAALRPLGHTVLEAMDGQAGLEAVDLHSPDLIITDLLMPKLDGFGMLRGMRGRGYTAPVIVLSADIQGSSKEISQELGVSVFLNKPFQASDLVTHVQRLLSATVTAD